MKTISLIGFIALFLTLTNSSNISTELVPEPNITDELVKSRTEKGRYVNSFNPKYQSPRPMAFLRWKISAPANTRLPSTIQELDKILPVIRHEKPEELNRTTAGLRFIWIGHASCYVQMNNFRFLVDPVFR
jgi:hypothetical protein